MRSVADDLREELRAETAALSPLEGLEQSFRLWEEGLEAFRQQHGLDRKTAFFATAPAGASEMANIAARYGVPPEIIVALWGMESGFGRNIGDYNIVGSLATLSYQGRRAAFFRKELINALHIIDQEHMPVTALRGSWAGAMGQCQFMPSTYLRYAVDYDGDGRSDIWNDPRDVWASIANYLVAEGWQRELTWGREVQTGDSIVMVGKKEVGKRNFIGEDCACM